MNHCCRFNLLNNDDSVPFDIEQADNEKPFTAFYCADLDLNERDKLEKEFFINKKFPILLTTSSLAYGVNLPADVVIIPVQFNIKKFPEFFPDIIDCVQMAGRAGRFGISDKGNVYFVVKTSLNKTKEAETYLENINKYPYKDVLSEINKIPLLSNLCLFSVEQNNSIYTIPDYSFYAHITNVSSEEIKNVFTFLKRHKYINKQTLSKKGKFCLSSGINPFSFERMISIIEDVLKKAKFISADGIITALFLSSLSLSGLKADLTYKHFMYQLNQFKNIKQLIQVMQDLPDASYVKKAFKRI